MRKRQHKGYSLLELPLGVWLALILFGLPAICYATLTYRAAFFLFAVNDACTRAARAASFTGAQKIGGDVFAKDIGAFTAIRQPHIDVLAVEQPLPPADPLGRPSGAPPEPSRLSKSPISDVDTANNVYYIQADATAQIEPLVSFGPNGFMGMNIPGLTGPYSMNAHSRKYCELPQGLNK